MSPARYRRSRRRSRFSLLPRFPRLPRLPGLGRRSGPVLAIGLLTVAGIGLMAPGQERQSATRPSFQQVATSTATARFSMCGRNRYTCVVDGDTIWLEGQNLRLQSYDTPEPYTDICGGAAEVALAKQASARLLQLLNGNAFSVETAGTDRYGRILATVRVGGRDVGDILIAEGLARSWPDGDEWWCS
jgi:endonuclease YncB( thermonuclease family)